MTATPDVKLPDLEHRLRRLYGSRGPECAARIEAVLREFMGRDDRPVGSRQQTGSGPWDQRDVVLITYADQVAHPGESPLATLRKFLIDEGWERFLRTVHLLPFYPYSSDDGFSVIDYQQLDLQFGTWDDVAQLGRQFDLMFDLVLNHISQQSRWFQNYLAGISPYTRFFIETDPAADLSAVVRPRSLPLLTPFETSRGRRHVWTTFSDDQIDLNYAEPEVLVRMIEVLLDYVRRGARILRLDAVAFLWKRLGTGCIHLPETHEVVKLLRTIVGAVAPQVLILTETNVPHAENVSYFGDGDEAHMVYQFSLPPLLLDAFVNEDAGPLTTWLGGLEPPQPGTTYFNFTASHDGIGVRPLEGLVDTQRQERLREHVRSAGGHISTRRQADGTDVPYELNITYVDALQPPKPDVELHARRFLATQAVMLGMQGMPAVYFHSLVGSQNDQQGVASSGQPRRINRHKYTLDELRTILHNTGSSPTTLAQRIYAGYRRLLAARIAQPAFHPDAAQCVVESGHPAVLALERTSTDGGQRILVAVNVSGAQQMLGAKTQDGPKYDLISGRTLDASRQIELAPGEAVWLTDRG